MKHSPLEDVPNSQLKRGFDIAVSFILMLFVFSWLWPIIILAIKMNSKGPVLYKQERWGKNNNRFWCYKFRSMIYNCHQFDDRGNFLQASKNDHRVTRVGTFLRRVGFDELPQFFCILRGAMSMVGPRPHPTSLNLEFKTKIDDYLLRHVIKPGITGWAQIHGWRGETKDLTAMQKRIEHDLWYIENWSFGLDLKILLISLGLMIKGDPKAC